MYGRLACLSVILGAFYLVFGGLIIPHREGIFHSGLKLVARAVDPNPFDYYLGYRGADFNTRWAKYYNDTPITKSAEFLAGLARSPVNASLGLRIQDAGKALNKPGYLPLESGYAFLDDGSLELAIRTDQPSTFSGEQFDFWFSWHINDTTKYKLWYPGAHQYAAVDAQQLVNESPKNTYRQRYWNATSFVDEYIGSTPYQISIGFFDPRLMNFSYSNPSTGVETIVTAFVRLFTFSDQDPAASARAGFGPFDVVLAHQVRVKPDKSGKEIRSRFWFGSGLVTGLSLVGMRNSLPRDLSEHTFSEMSHLGTFLPALFKEFKNDIPTVTQ